MIHLNIESRFQGQNLDRVLKRSAKAVLDYAGIGQDIGVSLAITGDAKIKELNHQFRGEDQATDVLSFPAEADGWSGSGYLGDVVVSLPRAKEQAKIGGHSVETEIQLLAVHGVLHLLGFDHEDPSDKTRMWEAQSEILGKLGLDITTEYAERPHTA